MEHTCNFVENLAAFRERNWICLVSWTPPGYLVNGGGSRPKICLRLTLKTDLLIALEYPRQKNILKRF
jgi:hypothetical protein